MATRAQIKANANNAKKSTGPRTKQGKSRAAKNALKHGLLARDTVLPGEDPADFDSQLAALEADILPANSLEFELVRQIADSQWRMRRLTRLETGFIAAAVDRTRRHAKKHCPDTLRPGYDGETLLLGSAMLDHTQALVHLARYDGHLSRRFFRAVKQLADLRRDELKADEARSSAGSYTPTDPYRGPYVPAQAPPPIDTPNPTAGRIGFRASGHSAPPAGLSKMGANSRVPQGAGPPAAGSVKRPPTGRWEKIADCHKRRPERHVESVTSQPRWTVPSIFLWRTPPPCRHSRRHRVPESTLPQTPRAAVSTLTNRK